MWDFYIIHLLPWASIFWITMLIDCLINPSVKRQAKFWWLICIFFTHGVGAFFYLILGPSYLLHLLMSFFIDPSNSLQNGKQKNKKKQKQPQPKTYYVPTHPQDYQPTYEYDQGYQAQNTQIPEGREPQHYSADYEQPQTSYPEMPQQQSM